jgi:putative hydrolase of the HAD superfamily
LNIKGSGDILKNMNFLWDFDGTLAYRDGMWSGTLFSVLNKNGIDDILLENIKPYLKTGFTWHNSELSHKELFKGKTWWEYYENYFENIFINLGIYKETAEKLSKQIKTEYMDKTKWHIYNDVIKTLEKIIGNGDRNIIISNHIPELGEIVNDLDIGKYFIKIYSSGNIGYEKPNKKFYEYVLKNSKIKRNECVIIGDSYESDITGGESMKIKSILVRKENKNNKGLYCKDFDELLERINKNEVRINCT